MAKQPGIEKLTAELDKVKRRRKELDEKARFLEEKILECRRQEIIGLVESADLSPEQLSVVIENAKKGILGVIPGKETKKSEE